MATILDSALNDLSSKTKEDRAIALREAVSSLSREQKEEFQRALGIQISDPDQPTSNTVWLIIVRAFVIVMVGAVLIMAISLFVAPVSSGTKPETILTVFTTVTAFLAGLFAPSPVAQKAGG
jgi:hypothetical protein